MNRRILWNRVLGWIVLGALIVITLFPFYWMLRTALSSNGALPSHSTSLLPAGFTFDGFARALGLVSREEAQAQGGSGAVTNLWRALGNSVIVVTLTTVVQTLSCALAAYSLSRLRWRGRTIVFGLLMSGMMIPGIVTLIPNFVLIKDLGLLNSVLGIALPGLLVSAFAIFFLRQFFMGVSTEIEDAARLDGAGPFRIFWSVMLPIIAPALFTLALITYIQEWNDYLWPLLIASDEQSRTLTVAIGVFKSQSPATGADWPALMAATLIAALPMLLLLIAFGKRIVNSIGFTGSR